MYIRVLIHGISRNWPRQFRLHCLLLLPLFVVAPIVCMGLVSGLWFVLQYFVSLLVLQSSRLGRESGLLYLSCFLNVMSLVRSFPLSYGAMGWSVECDYGISSSIHLILSNNLTSSHAYLVCLHLCSYSNGVAPITQYTHVRNKNSNTQGSSRYMLKVIVHTFKN